MFKATIKEDKLKLFKDIITACSIINDNVNIKLDENGISISTMDSSHISLCQVYIDKELFKEIECDKLYVVGITLSQLLTILKFSPSSEDFTIIYNEGQDVISLLFTNSSFEMKLMDIEVDELNVPDMEYTCVVEYKSKDFSSNISKYENIGNNLTITYSDKKVKYNVKGDNISCNDNPIYVNIVQNNDNNKLNIYTGIKLISKAIKASNISDTMYLGLSNDYPILLHFKTGNTFVKYHIAPRLEED